jgi:hypothetical protein
MNTILAFLFELFSRLKTESPTFFKKLQWGSGILLSICGVLKLLLSTKVWLPTNADGINDFLGYAITAITTVFGTSFLPTKDVSLSNANRMADGPGTDPNKPHGQKPA